MKDSELRGYILQYFYDRRRKGNLLAPEPADLGVDVDKQHIFHVCDQLREQNLLQWKPEKSVMADSFGEIISGSPGKITSFGIDVVEENETPAIKVEFVQHNNNTVNITGSTNVNNIIGSNNTLTLSELAKAIESADATPQEKEGAKTLFRKFLEHPLVSALAGGAVSLLGS
ncbi:hypothetical protein [Candidatus Electronema sp. JM]|uniref:hypothetical protein n=1 Tax=Candidatus Electronema sp. JM TaxID=3401571 RepID=UPI003AA8331E